MLVDYLGGIKIEIGLKDDKSKNPMDVALILNYPSMI